MGAWSHSGHIKANGETAICISAAGSYLIGTKLDGNIFLTAKAGAVNSGSFTNSS